MRGKAVEKNSVWRGMRHERGVDLIWRKYRCAHFGLALLTHAGPDVGINGLRAGHSFLRRAEQFNRAMRGGRIATRRLDNFRVRLVSRGCRDAHVRAYTRSGNHQGMANVVAVADVGEFHSARGAEFFFQREKIRKRLARMVDIRERVDDGNTGKCRQGVKSILLKYARDDSVHPTRKAPRDIGNRFALAETSVRVIEQNGRASHAYDANFKGDARAQGRLFKNHGKESARESILVAIRMRLHVRRETK